MDAISFTRAAKNLGVVIDQAQAAPVHITRTDGRSVVVMSADEYTSMIETLRIYTSPQNRADLERAIAAAKRGDVVELDPTA